MKAVLLAALSLLATVGCSARPPAAWASGGTRLKLAEAAWHLSDGDVVLRADGRVTIDGSLAFSVDEAGRIYDDDRDPAGVLLPDGNIQGTDDGHLGRVGITNASPPGGDVAWVQVAPDGSVTLYDFDGDRRAAGRWTGCRGAVLRTCTLVTHLVVLERAARAQRSGMSFGVGVGIYR